jgi:hypothetical protein
MEFIADLQDLLDTEKRLGHLYQDEKETSKVKDEQYVVERMPDHLRKAY